MTEPFLEPAERERVNLRTAIAAVELQVSELAAQALGGTYATTADTLASSWKKLVPLIAPEAEPERRPCPHCQRRIMRAATRCMYCLEKSNPPPA